MCWTAAGELVEGVGPEYIVEVEIVTANDKEPHDT